METDKFTIERTDNGYIVRVHQYGADQNVVFKHDEFADLLQLLINTYAPAEWLAVVRSSDDGIALQNKDETND